MFLRSMSTNCSRAVFTKANQFVEITHSCRVTLSDQFSTLRTREDDDKAKSQKPKFPNKFANKFIISPPINRNIRDFRYNFNKKYQGKPEEKPIKKNLYQPLDIAHPKVVIDNYRKKHEIAVNGPAPNPILSFDEISLPDYVANELKSRQFKMPTPIQAQSWPVALSGSNLIGIAPTGSGKTLAYILPAIVHINNQEKLSDGDGPIVLVLAPTTELVQQIQKVANEYGAVSQIRSVCVFGGVDRLPQAHDLQKGCEILIATPGRLIDMIDSGITNLQRCTYLVLDDADRILDKRQGLEPEIWNILERIRPDRQTFMCSATWPKEVRPLAKDILRSYTQINVGPLELCANHNINQIIHLCDENEKEKLLQEILQKIYTNTDENPGKTLIFSQTKSVADYLEQFVQQLGIKCCSIHGHKYQSDRDNGLDAFRSGRVNVMVATNVASRGLDVDEINFVINFDYPATSTDYIHRIGRTGRRGLIGTSHTFFTQLDDYHSRDLVTILLEANQEVPAKLMEMARKKWIGFGNSTTNQFIKNVDSGSCRNGGGFDIIQKLKCAHRYMDPPNFIIGYNNHRRQNRKGSFRSRNKMSDDD